MQPYFLPYIGYFQLISAVDTFVVYDDVKYTKKGWINRNRYLVDGHDAVFSLPLKGDADHLDVRDRRLAPDFRRDRLLNRLGEAYRRAPCFARVFPLLERIVRYDDDNLFGFLHHSIVQVCAGLGIGTRLRVSSGFDIDPALRHQDRVLALCEAAGADTYVNASGGTALYSHEAFRARGITLRFIASRPIEYAQFGAPFVPWLSIVDVMMFNPPEAIRERLLPGYELA